jgi:phosphoglycolate phosphatase-like HAD superfamily hydrolase
MQLVIFDIDGTLIESNALDSECYLQALEECGFQDVDTEWSHYRHVTDCGIYDEIFKQRHGRAPDECETKQFQISLSRALSKALAQSSVSMIQGAREFLTHLGSSSRHKIAFATGCWSDSARIKMKCLELSLEPYPFASADDALERESIMKLAIERAAEHYAQKFQSKAYIGDGIWDAEACKNIGLPFVGIGKGEHVEKLLAKGAMCVFTDLSDIDSIVRVLNEIQEKRIITNEGITG